jgi:hypothetical protein
MYFNIINIESKYINLKINEFITNNNILKLNII